MPAVFPVANRSDSLARGLEDNLKIPAGARVREPQFARVTLGNVLSAFGAAQIPGHLWIPQHLLIQGQVVLAPWLELHGVLIGSIAW